MKETIRGKTKMAYLNVSEEKTNAFKNNQAENVKLSAKIRPRDYKTFFVLNSTEHEIFPAHKC